MMTSPKWCRWIDHSGPIVAVGVVEVTCKKNMPGGSVVLPGRWWIRKCKRCQETFSHSYDIVDSRNEKGAMEHAR